MPLFCLPQSSALSVFTPSPATYSSLFRPIQPILFASLAVLTACPFRHTQYPSTSPFSSRHSSWQFSDHHNKLNPTTKMRAQLHYHFGWKTYTFFRRNYNHTQPTNISSHQSLSSIHLWQRHKDDNMCSMQQPWIYHYNHTFGDPPQPTGTFCRRAEKYVSQVICLCTSSLFTAPEINLQFWTHLSTQSPTSIIYLAGILGEPFATPDSVIADKWPR